MNALRLEQAQMAQARRTIRWRWWGRSTAWGYRHEASSTADELLKAGGNRRQNPATQLRVRLLDQLRLEITD
jgi:hypothetical protein